MLKASIKCHVKKATDCSLFFLKAFLLEKICFFTYLFGFFACRAKSQTRGYIVFLAAFLRTPQAGDGDATCLEKGAQKWPKIF